MNITRTVARTFVVLALALALPYVTRGFAHVILTVGNVWTAHVLPALTLAAPVGVPILAASLIFVALARFDTRR